MLTGRFVRWMRTHLRRRMLPLSGIVLVLITGTATAAAPVRSGVTVPAERQALTTNASSPVVHDNEVMALALHADRLFAATDQWEYRGSHPYGQILVKRSARSPWAVFERTQSVRVQALDSFTVPADQGLGRGHSLLITQAIIHGRSEIQWLLDGASSFARHDAYVLPAGADVRAFGAHQSGGVWSVYAGVGPTGILRATWSRRRRTLVFDRRPELLAAPPRSGGQKTRKVTGFADCAGALYVSINTKLYRRNDQRLPAGVTRWALVYQAPPVGAFNSGIRGLSCIPHGRTSSLLISTEGSGNVYRFDHLPKGQIRGQPTTGPGRRLKPILEFTPIPAIRQMLARQGVYVPLSGAGSIGYVIAAYNNFEAVTIGGLRRQLFGFEWGYVGRCSPTRTCGPTAFTAIHFDARACFAVRSDRGAAASYELRCLGGRQLTPSGRRNPPIRSGQAFVSIRTIKPSPFRDARIYFGGYDCNFFPADGTAWVANSRIAALHL